MPAIARKNSGRIAVELVVNHRNLGGQGRIVSDGLAIKVLGIALSEPVSGLRFHPVHAQVGVGDDHLVVFGHLAVAQLGRITRSPRLQVFFHPRPIAHAAAAP